MSEIVFENLPERDTPLTIPVYLLRGQVDDSRRGVIAVCTRKLDSDDTRTEYYDTMDGQFKIWLQLWEGENVICVKFVEKRDSDAEVYGEKEIKVNYKKDLKAEKMRLCVVSAQDSPETFECENPAVYEGRWRAATVNKMRVAAIMLQMYVMDEMTRGGLGPKSYSFNEEKDGLEVEFVKLNETLEKVAKMDHSSLRKSIARAVAESLPNSRAAVVVFLDSRSPGNLDPVGGYCYKKCLMGMIGSLGFHSWPETLEDARRTLTDSRVISGKAVTDVCTLYEEMVNGDTIVEDRWSIEDDSEAEHTFTVLRCFEKTLGVLIQSVCLENYYRSGFAQPDCSTSLRLNAKFLCGQGEELHMNRGKLLGLLFSPLLGPQHSNCRSRMSVLQRKNKSIVRCSASIYMLELVSAGHVYRRWELLPDTFDDLEVGRLTLRNNVIHRSNPYPGDAPVIRAFSTSCGMMKPVELSRLGKTPMIGRSRNRSEHCSLIFDRTKNLSRIRISTGAAIDGITAFYDDGTSSTIGGAHTGDKNFVLDPGEYITGVEINEGFDIDGILFVTNKRRSEKYWTGGVSRFHKMKIPDGARFVGIYGGFDHWMQAMGALYEYV